MPRGYGMPKRSLDQMSSIGVSHRESMSLEAFDEFGAASAQQRSLNTAGCIPHALSFIGSADSANVESVYREMESCGSDRIGQSVPIGHSFTHSHSVTHSHSNNFDPYGPFVQTVSILYSIFNVRYRPGQSSALCTATATYGYLGVVPSHVFASATGKWSEVHGDTLPSWQWASIERGTMEMRDFRLMRRSSPELSYDGEFVNIPCCENMHVKSSDTTVVYDVQEYMKAMAAVERGNPVTVAIPPSSAAVSMGPESTEVYQLHLAAVVVSISNNPPSPRPVYSSARSRSTLSSGSASAPSESASQISVKQIVLVPVATVSDAKGVVKVDEPLEGRDGSSRHAYTSGSQCIEHPPIGAERCKPGNQQSVQANVHVDWPGASHEAWESTSHRLSQTEEEGQREDMAAGEVAPEVVRQLAKSLIQLSGIQPGLLLDVDHSSRRRVQGHHSSPVESNHRPVRTMMLGK